MMVRTLLSLINLGVIAAAVAIWLAFPQYAGVAVYGLLGWMLLTFIVMYSPWGNRPVSSSSNGAAAPSTASFGALPASAPLPSAPSTPASTPTIDFCVFCGTTLPAGANRCPACGHPVVGL